MLQRVIVVVLVLLAVGLWVGLAFFMSYRPPDPVNRLVFLAIWGATIACTAIPLAYTANAQLRGYYGRRWALGQAIRQGLMAAALATVLMALRFIGALNLLVGVLLTLVVVMAEVLVQAKSR